MYVATYVHGWFLQIQYTDKGRLTHYKEIDDFVITRMESIILSHVKDHVASYTT